MTSIASDTMHTFPYDSFDAGNCNFLLPTHPRPGVELSLKLSIISEYVGSKIWQAYVGIWDQGRFANESRARSAGLGPIKKGAKSG
mgnify:CR=1 FL=1